MTVTRIAGTMDESTVALDGCVVNASFTGVVGAVTLFLQPSIARPRAGTRMARRRRLAARERSEVVTDGLRV